MDRLFTLDLMSSILPFFGTFVEAHHLLVSTCKKSNTLFFDNQEWFIKLFKFSPTFNFRDLPSDSTLALIPPYLESAASFCVSLNNQEDSGWFESWIQTLQDQSVPALNLRVKVDLSVPQSVKHKCKFCKVSVASKDFRIFYEQQEYECH